ncbi:DUF4260 domain-containing protein [Labrys wisconsinensis]|uniref:DUF4260 family protein n=1 Tax=Labrys wisconsinensis TaxID=425677 RepID=A0ABU0JL70_9HYPH|nr:DUF4260 domain-containing protein [Labrys wisconsinensis]MDQ0475042.1 hypothetical protein [Labrys wisconsinensis]
MSPIPQVPPASGAVVGAPRLLLRLEGVAALAAAVLAYAAGGHDWTVFALLFLAPDLTMLGYVGGPGIGAALYNLGHTYVVPAGLGALGWVAGQPWLLASALVWIAHIGFDRALGYGLKYDDAFGHTHLGRSGRSA